MLLFLYLCVVSAQNLSSSQTQLVIDRLASGSTKSWEIGTRAQALLSYSNSQYSVFYSGDDPDTYNDPSSRFGLFLPPPQHVSEDQLQPILQIAKDVVGNRTRGMAGPQPLMSDGSAADPASIGVAVLIANWTGAEQPEGGVTYAQAAEEQLQYLLEVVPRSKEGAISHRVKRVQLWSDFIYMVPPFLAYYGVLTSNKTLITESVNQISLYRDQLRDPDAAGLWRHIVTLEEGEADGEPGDDLGYWSTGNAWSAAGILRVLATIQHSPFASSFQHETVVLQEWAEEILWAMFTGGGSEQGGLDPTTSLFPNYIVPPSSQISPPQRPVFPDAASTSLLTACVYRLALLRDVWHWLPMAEDVRAVLFQSQGGDGNLTHFTSTGWLTPVVNPNSYPQQLNFSGEQKGSPEAQAFVLELMTSWGTWRDAGERGANGAFSTRIGGVGLVFIVFVFTLGFFL